MTGWGNRRQQRPDPGVELKDDATLFDVPAWRSGQTSALSDVNTELDAQTAIAQSSFSELQDINTELDAQTVLLQEIAGDTGGDASTATIAQVTLANTASTNLKTASTDFVSFTVSNESDIDVWLKFQDAATDADKKGIFLERGAYYEMPTGQRYTGTISAIADSGAPVVNVVYY